MMFDSFSGNRRSRLHTASASAPAIVESLEIRALLAAPQVVTPVGTITDSTPVISWEAVDGADSYDVWVTDVETREVIFLREGIPSTSLVAPEELHLGRNRIWAKANFADGSTTGWGAPSVVLLQVAPVITGPSNALQPPPGLKINETNPTITWTSPPGARSFDIFLSDQTTLTSRKFNVKNLTPKLDADGNTIPDGNGDVVREEIREFKMPGDLPMGKYRIFMRTMDDGGRLSAWTEAYDFEIAPAVKLLRPTGPTFQKAPLLEWEAVPGATHYEVWVNKASAPNTAPSLYPYKYLTTTSFQIPKELATGEYVFAVRARRLHQVTEINLTGTPTSGSYTISLTTFGKDGTTVTTAPISFSASAAQIKAAVNALKGFEEADVVAAGAAPNLKYLLQIPQTSGQVNVTVAGAISPGTLTSSTTYSPEVVGLWSDSKRFSTLRNPVITAPVGVSTDDPLVRTVTDVRPTVEWTAIDKAARYDIWVDRSTSTSVYLKTTSPTNSYTFASDIEPGKYTVWVRAVGPTGEMTGWSAEYKFTATGGAPVITSPAEGSFVLPFPTIRWAAVPNIASYEIQIAWLGVDFTYIQTPGITLTEFTPTDPLNSGNYRVWVRAIKADGTALSWSKQVNFKVADTEQPSDTSVDELELLALNSTLPVNALQNRRSTGSPSEVNGHSAAQPGQVAAIAEEIRSPEEGSAGSASSLPPAQAGRITDVPTDLIQQLAEKCNTQEWWNASTEA